MPVSKPATNAAGGEIGRNIVVHPLAAQAHDGMPHQSDQDSAYGRRRNDVRRKVHYFEIQFSRLSTNGLQRLDNHFCHRITFSVAVAAWSTISKS
jgi:hypothetical protein